MKKKPWMADGFAFYTTAMQRWLGGYEPVLGAALLEKKKGKPATEEAARALRDAQLTGSATHRNTPMKERYP